MPRNISGVPPGPATAQPHLRNQRMPGVVLAIAGFCHGQSRARLPFGGFGIFLEQREFRVGQVAMQRRKLPNVLQRL